jgi:hypothetical protein
MLWMRHHALLGDIQPVRRRGKNFSPCPPLTSEETDVAREMIADDGFDSLSEPKPGHAVISSTLEGSKSQTASIWLTDCSCRRTWRVAGPRLRTPFESKIRATRVTSSIYRAESVIFGIFKPKRNRYSRGASWIPIAGSGSLRGCMPGVTPK